MSDDTIDPSELSDDMIDAMRTFIDDAMRILWEADVDENLDDLEGRLDALEDRVAALKSTSSAPCADFVARSVQAGDHKSEADTPDDDDILDELDDGGGDDETDDDTNIDHDADRALDRVSEEYFEECEDDTDSHSHLPGNFRDPEHWMPEDGEAVVAWLQDDGGKFVCNGRYRAGGQKVITGGDKTDVKWGDCFAALPASLPVEGGGDE